MSEDRNQEQPGRRGVPSAGFGTGAFQDWITNAASYLTEDLDVRHHYETNAPGGVSEAAAYLLSRVALAPDAEGHPTLEGHGGISKIDDFEKLATVLYATSFPKEQYHNENIDLFVRFESDFADTEPPEQREMITLIKAVGVLFAPEDPTQATESVLIFHERGLHLNELACETLEDLKRLHARIRSCAIR